MTPLAVGASFATLSFDIAKALSGSAMYRRGSAALFADSSFKCVLACLASRQAEAVRNAIATPVQVAAPSLSLVAGLTLAALELRRRWTTPRNPLPPLSGPACLAKTRSFAAQPEVSHSGCA